MNIKCTNCNSEQYVKAGFRKIKNKKIQRYKCKKCDFYFTGKEKYYEFSKENISDMMLDYQKGLSQTQIASKYKTQIRTIQHYISKDMNKKITNTQKSIFKLHISAKDIFHRLRYYKLVYKKINSLEFVINELIKKQFSVRSIHYLVNYYWLYDKRRKKLVVKTSIDPIIQSNRYTTISYKKVTDISKTIQTDIKPIYMFSKRNDKPIFIYHLSILKKMIYVIRIRDKNIDRLTPISKENRTILQKHTFNIAIKLRFNNKLSDKHMLAHLGKYNIFLLSKNLKEVYSFYKITNRNIFKLCSEYNKLMNKDYYINTFKIIFKNDCFFHFSIRNPNVDNKKQENHCIDISKIKS